jgi:hypothetical protein
MAEAERKVGELLVRLDTAFAEVETSIAGLARPSLEDPTVLH